MANEQTIFLAGGGSGGHLYPGVSVAEALREIDPGIRLIFLGTTRHIDQTILEPTGFEFIPQPIVPPHKSIAGLIRFWRAWRETQDLVRRLLRDHRPRAVLGLGGYAAGVAVKLAAKEGITAALLNQDVIPGKANRYLVKYAQRVFCQYERTQRYLPASERHKFVHSGCPIRSDIRTLPTRESAAGRLGLDLKLKTLVVTGGSQGAQTLNEAVPLALEAVRRSGWQVLHIASSAALPAVQSRYTQLGMPGRVIDFTPAMADVYAVADLMVSRSGGSTCAEIAACGIPSILLPYPFHKDMHQRANARELQTAGAAALIADQREARRNAEKLGPELEKLMHDDEYRRQMAEAAGKMGRPDAADQVARALLELISARHIGA